jgi:hypothetical protein
MPASIRKLTFVSKVGGFSLFNQKETLSLFYFIQGLKNL